MKKFLAASLAAFLLFTAAACTRQSSPQQTPEPAQPVTQEPAAQPEAPAQEPAEPIRITPNQQGSATPSDAVWLDEPDTIQTDLEEIVTCTYTLPHLTLETDEASAAANAIFDTLSQTVLSYAQETVYPHRAGKAGHRLRQRRLQHQRSGRNAGRRLYAVRLLFHGDLGPAVHAHLYHRSFHRRAFEGGVNVSRETFPWTMSELHRGDPLQVSIETATIDGSGVARVDGQVVFVPGALPGERCSIRIAHVGRSAVFALLLSVLTPSAHRVEPDCPYFPICGGCALRHMDYEQELELKRAHV